MTLTEANVAVLTSAELSALALMLATERSPLADALELPGADKTEIAEAGIASLIARGLVWSEDGELVVDPMTAAAGIAVAEPQRCVALLGIRDDEPVAVGRIVETDGTRMMLMPLPPHNVGFSLLDSSASFIEALAAVIEDSLSHLSQVGIALEIENGAVADGSILIERGGDGAGIVHSLGQLWPA